MFDTRQALDNFYKGLEPGVNTVPLAAAMVIGMKLALNHPEYAQAFCKALMEQRPAVDTHSRLAYSFIRDNPIEMVSEV